MLAKKDIEALLSDNDLNAASSALGQWFKSQEIGLLDGTIVMAMTMAKALILLAREGGKSREDAARIGSFMVDNAIMTAKTKP